MSQENLEIVHGIYCRPLSLDPDLLTGLAEFATPDTVFEFTDAYPRWTRDERGGRGPSDR